MPEIDDIDRQLLKILQNKSDYTTKELARMVHLTPTPVFERIKRLEKTGIIRKYVAILDAEKLQSGFQVFCNIRLKQHTKEIGKAFIDGIMQIEEVTECYNISGDYDFMLKVHVRDMKHYQDFVLNKLGALDSIGNTQSTFVMGTIKNVHGINF